MPIELETDPAQQYASMMDSVHLVEELEAKETLTGDETSSLTANKNHVWLMLQKDFWTDEDMTLAEAVAERPVDASGSNTPIDPLSVKLTRKQIRVALVEFAGKSSTFITDLIQAMPDGVAKDLTSINWEETSYHDRHHPSIEAMLGSAGFTDEEADALWIKAVDLPR